MTHRYIKISLTVVVLTLAFSGLMWATLREGAEYYKHVDEVMANPSPWEGKKMQLHGFVVPGSIKKKQAPGSYEYRFKLQYPRDNGHVVDAAYTGIVPDTFKDDSEVVLKGRLASIVMPDGTTVQGFATIPDGIMAKCPSKYEESNKVGYEQTKKVS
jgi:cytochrome c-type biogenesis protein CcmE